MNIANTKFKKTLIIVFGSIVILAIALVLLISPITKFLIEKYDTRFTGRQIRVGWVYVNPFTGYIHISNLKIFESDSFPNLTNRDSIFFSANSVSANFAVLKLLSKTIEITAITLDHPIGIIHQSKDDFNFNDIITRYTPEKSDTIPSLIHFNVHKIKIENGSFYYYEKAIPVFYFIKDANFESSGINWDSDSIAVKFSFLSGTGDGSANGDLSINFNNLNYHLNAIVHKFDLQFLDQYFSDITNYGTFSAILDANINSIGNLIDKENLNAKGLIVLNDFHFGKTSEDDYASFDKLVLSIDKLNPKGHQYLFDSVMLSHPYFKYEMYDHLDNLQTMFGENGVNISEAKQDHARFNLVLEIADYIKILAKNFFQSDYKINKLAIYNGRLKFNDYASTEKFSMEANPFNVFADSINKNRKRVSVVLNSGLKPYGNVLVNLSINPKDSGDFDMKYNIQKVPATILNPYLITYTSYPLDRGTIEINGTWNVRNSIIKSNNHLVIIDPRISKRINNDDTRWIPTFLLMSFIRERGNVIDYEIPITGDLKNPKFHLHDVLFDLFENVFVKPVTTPYRMQVKRIENKIENTLTLKWEMRQCSLQLKQERFIKHMADFLIHNPDANIAVYPIQYVEKEREYILFFEAKKKYFLNSKNRSAKSFNESDSIIVEKMSVKDCEFVQYLNKLLHDSLLFTIQDKCIKYVGLNTVNLKYEQLNNQRVNLFLLPFKNKGVENRVRIYKAENSIPYNGFSFYNIVYKGDFPKSLIKAYQQMNELNNEPPRKKFEKERENIIN